MDAESPGMSAAAVRAPRARPSQRTFLVRRLTALGVLLVLVLLLVSLVEALFGGGEPGSPATAPKAPEGAPPLPPHARTVLDKLVAADRTLAPGATGAPARGLQQALTTLGHPPGPADGVYSDGTRAAVAAFQTADGLPATGTVDATTATALRRALTLWAAARTETIRSALAAAQARGELSEAAVGEDGAIAMEAALQLPRLPAGRAAVLDAVLDDVASHGPVYDVPRATALFGMLDFNRRRLVAAGLPGQGTDRQDRDGTIYRYISGRGYQFHPLANFARLNRDVARRRLDDARRLATALHARAVADDGGLVWEYYWAFDGPSRWTSALAQSAGAQALLRAGTALGDEGIARDGREAFAAIPRALARPLAGGAWVREYSYSDLAVLNAQLQSLVSLTEYAKAADDDRAVAFAGQLSTAARATLPSLDTGRWSRYAIDGAEASQHYHCYHVDLLRQLEEEEPANAAFWGEWATKWERYATARGGCDGA